MNELTKLLDGNKTYLLVLIIFGLLIYAGQQGAMTEQVQLWVDGLLAAAIGTTRMGVKKAEKANGKNGNSNKGVV